MRCRWPLSAVLSGVACEGVDVPDPPDVTRPVEADLDALLAEAGYEVQQGAFVFADLAGCCGPEAYCWGNNPSTPYGMHALPGPPGHDAVRPDILADLGTLPPDLSFTWRLRPDEAVLVLGALPPPATYLGYSSYLADRPGTAFPIVGSLGAPLNNQVLDRSYGDAWGQPFALLTTLDGAVAREVRGLLEATGYAPHEVLDDPLPGPLVRPGWDGGADTYMSLLRVALYDDPVAGAAYQADPGLRALRLTPLDERPWEEPHPLPILPVRGAGTDESALSEALDALSAAVSAVFADRTTTPGVTVPYFPETLGCIDSGRSCAGNLHDRYAAVSVDFVLRPGELVVAHGVNHARAGKATYSSASMQTVDTQTGIASFASDRMVGSARAWLPDHPQADDLYAVAFARSCQGVPGVCVEVPFGCPGAAAGQPLKITARAYLEPSTGAAPLAAELLVDRLIKVGEPR